MSFVKNLFDNAKNVLDSPFKDREGANERKLARRFAAGRESKQLPPLPDVERSRILGSSAVGGG